MVAGGQTRVGTATCVEPPEALVGGCGRCPAVAWSSFWDRNFDRDRWELYDTDEDPTESHDLAGEHPTKVQEMINLWFHEAGKYNGLPLLDCTAVEVLADPSRPQVAPPRDR